MLIEDEKLREILINKGLEISRSNSVKNVFKDLIRSFDEFEKIRFCWEN
jgi:hypothetical protein